MESQVILETSRLRVLPFENADLPLLEDLHSDPNVNRHLMPADAIYRRGDIAARLEQYRTNRSRYGFSQWKVEAHSGEFVGKAGFLVFKDTAEAVLSLCFATRHWGLGYASELVPELVDWFFDNTYYSHLIAFVGAGNEPSRRVMEKAGFKARQRVTIEGRAFDCLQVFSPSIAKRYPMTA